jgi:hypothetical protein
MRRLILAAAVLLSATSLFADDLFTLYVPVRVSHLHPSISQITVRCSLNGRDPATGALMTWGPTAGKSQSFTITGGAYSGTATIIFTNADFSAAQMSTLSSVSAGRCELILLTSTGGVYYPWETGTGAITGHAAGTPFSNPVSFTIH